MNRRQENPQGLEALARQAKDYALHMMRTAGSIPPTVIADTAEGDGFCVPGAFTDDAAKDRFTDVARLLAVAHNARALVLIAEAWASLPDASGHIDTGTLQMMTLCLLPNLKGFKRVGEPKAAVEYDPMDLLRFIERNFIPLNTMMERAGMSEMDIDNRTRKILHYFNLPFDAEPPAE
jgi:hypothetical protein